MPIREEQGVPDLRVALAHRFAHALEDYWETSRSLVLVTEPNQFLEADSWRDVAGVQLGLAAGGWVVVSAPASQRAALVRAAAGAGIHRCLMVTRAVSLHPGCPAVAAVDDHINLTGANPLTGPNHSAWGVRFPDMSEPYDPVMRRQLAELGLPGIIVAGVPEEEWDEPARPGSIRRLGADAASAGLIEGVIAGVHCGIRIAAVVHTGSSDPAKAASRALRALS